MISVLADRANIFEGPAWAVALAVTLVILGIFGAPAVTRYYRRKVDEKQIGGNAFLDGDDDPKP